MYHSRNVCVSSIKYGAMCRLTKFTSTDVSLSCSNAFSVSDFENLKCFVNEGDSHAVFTKMFMCLGERVGQNLPTGDVRCILSSSRQKESSWQRVEYPCSPLIRVTWILGRHMMDRCLGRRGCSSKSKVVHGLTFHEKWLPTVNEPFCRRFAVYNKLRISLLIHLNNIMFI